MAHKHFLRSFRAMITLGAALFGWKSALAQQPVGGAEDQAQAVGFVNWKTATLGGKQFWSDVRVIGGWRIQKHARTGHFRLLDPANIRQGWGNLAHCNEILEDLITKGVIKPDEGRVILLIHGLIRTRSSMRGIGESLKKSVAATVIEIEYASCQAPISEHANNLAAVIDSLGPRVSEIDLVCHSMGNIVVRHYLADLQKRGKKNPPLSRMVMLAPPNQGSKMASILNNSLAFNAITGVSGFQLGKGWKQLEPNLAIPDFEFAIISGGTIEKKWLDNPFLSGPNDLTVEANETSLPGAKDSSLVPNYHAGLLADPVVHQQIATFLQTGFLVSADKANPIPCREQSH